MKRSYVLSLLVCLVSFAASAQTLDWSSIGSAGVIDDSTLGLYSTNGAALTIKTNAVATVEARYPVTNTVGTAFDQAPAWTTLSAALVDDGANGSVTVTLYEVDKCDGTETQVCQINSSDGTSAVECETCTFSSSTFDFANNAYYIEVSLTRSTSTPTEALYQLALY